MGPAWGGEEVFLPAKLADSAVERKRLPDDEPDISDSPVSGFVKIVRWHPMTNYFGYVADRIMPSYWSHDERFSQLAKRHPRWFRAAVFSDAALTACSALGVIVLLGVAAYKTVWL